MLKFLKDKKLFVTAAAFTIVIIAVAVFSAKAWSDSGEANVQSKQSVADVAQENVQQADKLKDAEENKPQDNKAEEAKVEEKKAEDNKPRIISYLVKQGDTVESIAKSFDVNVSTITESNNISQDSIIREGQELRFPSVKGILYKIKSGETLWDLSYDYDIDTTVIAEANSMGSPDKLSIDQEIIIPGADKIKVAKVQNKPASTVAAKPASQAVAQSYSNIKVASRGTSGSSAAAELSGMIWPVRGTITSGFGPRWGEFHPGIDIGIPVGTDLKAVLDGTVRFSGWQNGYGYIVILSHGNGIETYYSHNSKNLVSEGDKVNQGQVIAKSGNTGKSTGPHTEFGIRKNGTPVNPFLYLK